MSYKPIYLSIAGFVIKIIFNDSEYPHPTEKLIAEIKSIYSGFILTESPTMYDFLIVEAYKQRQLTITRNKTTCAEIFTKDLSNKTIYIPSTISIFQLSLILREIIFYLLNTTRSGFYLHCSAVYYSGKAHIFTGTNGAGKSTIASQLGSKYRILSDDTGIIRSIESDYFYYQSPVIEKNDKIRKTNQKYRIGSINFLNKFSHFKVIKIRDNAKIISLIAKELVTGSDLNFDHIHYPTIKWLFEFMKKFNNYNDLYFSKDKTEIIRSIFLLKNSNQYKNNI